MTPVKKCNNKGRFPSCYQKLNALCQEVALQDITLKYPVHFTPWLEMWNITVLRPVHFVTLAIGILDSLREIEPVIVDKTFYSHCYSRGGFILN